jgi:hypothetical protein
MNLRSFRESLESGAVASVLVWPALPDEPPGWRVEILADETAPSRASGFVRTTARDHRVRLFKSADAAIRFAREAGWNGPVQIQA